MVLCHGFFLCINVANYLKTNIMCLNDIKVKFCVKHNCNYSQYGNSNIFRCSECKKESNRNAYKNISAEKLIKKREAGKISQKNRRLVNREMFVKNENKYRQSDKFRDNKIKNAKVKFCNIYCLKCNEHRVYDSDYCNDCNKILFIINNYDYTSICKHCDKEYGLDVKIDNHGKVFQLNNYCSIECNNEGKSKRILNNKKQYKKTESYKNMKRNGSHKKRVITKGNKYEDIRRNVLFRRFNYICQGCNVKCVHPNGVNYNDNNCATIDHIKPVSKGGNHTYDNTQLLCRKCNTMKGNNEKYFEYKQKAKQIELQFDLNIHEAKTAKQLSFFEGDNQIYGGL